MKNIRKTLKQLFFFAEKPMLGYGPENLEKNT